MLKKVLKEKLVFSLLSLIVVMAVVLAIELGKPQADEKAVESELYRESAEETVALQQLGQHIFVYMMQNLVILSTPNGMVACAPMPATEEAICVNITPEEGYDT